MPTAKFGDFSFSRFSFIVRTDRQTDRITDADQRYTVGVSNYLIADADDDAVLDMSSADRESV